MNTTRLLPQPTGTQFPLGEVYITERAQQRLSVTRVINALARHSTRDWGDVDIEDFDANDLALEVGGQLLSAFGKGDRRFWIITIGDRSKTTVMLPADYVEELDNGDPFPRAVIGGQP